MIEQTASLQKGNRMAKAATTTTPATAGHTALPLPAWTDSAAVTSYITSVIATIGAVVTLAHPGYSEPTTVQAVVPSVAAIIAGIAQIVNVITHRSAAAKIVSAVVTGRTN